MDSNSQSLTSPPHPELAFRVGVVGHRPNRLKEADMNKLGTLIQDMLKAIKEEVESFKVTHGHFFDSSKPDLRALSPLAEGTDRLFAEQALYLSYELCCVMPFFKEEFEKDFLPPNALEENSLARFNDLLSKASIRFELDGNRKDNAMAYGAAGDVVLNQSDIIIVVWDGVRQGKQGGTEETMDAAIRMGVQVIWIDARTPHNWQFIDRDSPLPDSKSDEPLSPTGSHTLEEIKEKVNSSLEIPRILEDENEDSSGKKRESPEESLSNFYSERKPLWRVSGFIWKFFRDLLGRNKLVFSPLREKPFEDSVIRDWPRETSTPIDRIINSLRPFYAWIDKPAVIYSDKYHSAFITIFLLAAFSVGLALLPICVNLTEYPEIERYSIALEFISIIVILGIYFLGRKDRWHERWLDYRIGAELIRHLRLIAPLGGKRPFPQIPAHWSTFGQISSSWMSWYVHAIERRLGLPDARIDREYLKECLSKINSYITEQIKYHDYTYNRSNKIRNRLHIGSIILLILTLIACGIHLLHALSVQINLPEWLTPNILIFITGFFPALGASFAAMNNQGEFRRIAKRSEVMEKQLKLLQKKIIELEDKIISSPDSGAIQFSAEVTSKVSEAARLFVNEVLDWRVVFQDQPLKT